MQTEGAGPAELPVCRAPCSVQYVSDAEESCRIQPAERRLPTGETRAGKHINLESELLRSETSVCLYFQVRAGVENSWSEQMVWRSDLYLSCGILGFGVLTLLAITSLPSVGNALNWREFTFVQVMNRLQI